MPRSDSPEIRTRFDAEIGFADSIARLMMRELTISTHTYDEIRSFAREGLLLAARSFDESRGLPFRKWANVRVRGAVIDGLRKFGSMPRRMYRELQARRAAEEVMDAYQEEDAARAPSSAEDADARLAERLAGLATAMAIGLVAAPDSVEASNEEKYEQAETLARVRAAVAKLADAERTIVERMYFAGETLDEASAAAGLSKSWGCRLHARAIDAITRKLAQG